MLVHGSIDPLRLIPLPDYGLSYSNYLGRHSQKSIVSRGSCQGRFNAPERDAAQLHDLDGHLEAVAEQGRESGSPLTEAIYSRIIITLHHIISKPVDVIDHRRRQPTPDKCVHATGHGLDFEVTKGATEYLTPIVNDESCQYIGLNVHRKKRAPCWRLHDDTCKPI